MTCHCTCTAGMSQVCNHIAAALYIMESAVRNGLTNPACTSKANEWLPGSKKVADISGKLKDLKFEREDFGTRGKKRKTLDSKKKRDFLPIANSAKPLVLNDIANALLEIDPELTLKAGVSRDEEVNFAVVSSDDKTDIISVNSIITSSMNKEDFYANLFLQMSCDNISSIEKVTKGQSDNKVWFDCRKDVVTSSKAHDVLTKMRNWIRWR